LTPRRVAVVFAKRPAPGGVKTRMCPPLTHEQAAALYAAMLEDVLATTRAAAEESGARAWLVVHPPDAVDELAARCPPGFAVFPQRGADLGERMANALQSAADAGFERILLRGSDNPSLPRADLARAFAALDDADLAVGPDRDGGYGWIALRRPVPGLFDHAMSTATALADTLARAAASGLRVRQLEPHFDLDTAPDLLLLAAERRAGRVGECPRTLAVIDTLGLWDHAENRGSQVPPI
jgi:rSAM/selenodomain-associated transferase 1